MRLSHIVTSCWTNSLGWLHILIFSVILAVGVQAAGNTKASLSSPNGVTIVTPTAGLIQLSWLPVADAGSYRVYQVTNGEGVKLLSEVVTTTITLSSHFPLLVAVAATDSNGDSSSLSNAVELTTPPVEPSLLLPEYIPRDVVIVTDPANQQLVLKWRSPLDTSKVQGYFISVTLRNYFVQLWDFVPANSTMVTIGNLSPGLEYVISVFTKLDTSGRRSPTSVLYTTAPSLITGNQVPPHNGVGMFSVTQLYPNIFMLFWTSVNNTKSYNIYHGNGELLVSTVANSYIIDIQLINISQLFYVRPVNMAGEGPSSDTINLQAMMSSPLTVGPPQLLTAVYIQPMTILLSWLPPMHPPRDIEYKVLLDDDVVGMTTDNIFAIEGLTPGTSYVVMVTSCSEGVEGDSASITVHTPPATPPSVKKGTVGVPQLLNITTFNVTSATVAWLPVLGAHAYQVYFSYDGGREVHVQTDKTSYIISGMTYPSEVVVQVMALDGDGGRSSRSEGIKFRPPPQSFPDLTTSITAPQYSPDNVRLLLIHPPSVLVTWDHPINSSYIEGYRLYLSLAGSTNLVRTLSNNVTLDHMSELMPNTEYVLLIVPFNAHQLGPPAQVNFFTSSSSPPGSLLSDCLSEAPQRLSVTITDGYHVVFSWDAVTSAISYRLLELGRDGTITEVADTSATEYTTSSVQHSSLYVVVSVNVRGQSSFSNIVPIPTEPLVIAAPHRLRIASINKSSVTIIFSPPAITSFIKGYICQAFIQDDITLGRQLHHSIVTTARWCTFPTLHPMTQYYFTVQTYYQRQRSSANHISAYTSDMPVNTSRVLPAPVVVMVTNRTKSTITLHWSNVQGAQAYVVYHVIRGLSIPIMMTSQTVFTWSDLPSGIEVRLQVAAVSTSGVDGERSDLLVTSTLPHKGAVQLKTLQQTSPRGPPGPKGTMPNHIGPKGQPGNPGSDGAPGRDGAPGKDGEPGSKGDPGPPGDPGPAGPPGQRAPDVEADLYDPKGPPPVGSAVKGMKGNRGGDGPPGPPGPNGEPGHRGSTGHKGSMGPQGDPGNAGPAGPPGNPGQMGDDGPKGPPGPVGSAGDPGRAGAAGFKGLTGDKGETGARGAKGVQGGTGNQGATGRPGFQGPTGAPGPAGSPGNPGAQGSKGVPGKAGPAGPIGAPGDDGENGDSGADGAPGPDGLRGPRGAQGARGNVGPVGNAGEPGADGADGFPGKRGVAGGDGDAGPAGEAGDQGDTGVAGNPGPQGPMGAPGATGDPGPDGSAGDTGAPGKRGEDGGKGHPGEDGDKGHQGDPGHIGANGEQGDVGPEGPAGVQGPPGPKGPAGKAGVPGIPGKDGPKGYKGPPGLPGAPGKKGIDGIDGAPGAPGSAGLPGAVGRPGAAGLPGAAGRDGNPGTEGPAGNPGQAGDQGDQGPHGPPGLPGNRGAAGNDGRDGLAGLNGPIGEKGDTGDHGDPGPTGAPGPQGPAGDVGPDGEQGDQGAPGEDGADGETGPSGAPGPQGEKGPYGYPGDKGYPGPPGPRGAPGELARQGSPGPIGPPGEEGITGAPGIAGSPGHPGPRGPEGFPGLEGHPGPVGAPGAPGAKGGKGYPGEAGVPGDEGERGHPGNPGNDGPNGLPGPPGAPGSPGRPGPQGERGGQGPPGPQGAAGARGAPGRDGRPGEDGEAGPIGHPGAAGPNGLDGFASAPGPDGDPGDIGAPGARGKEGDTGDAGAAGPAGDAGPAGQLGPVGEPGPPGPTGFPGDQGDKGDEGAKGEPGPPGIDGKNGPPGLPGPSGPAGDPGPAGTEPGEVGAGGAPGDQGRPGNQGARGPVGLPGFAGEPGETGADGHAGLDGRPGSPGSRGETGRIGETGPAGDRGPAGIDGPKGFKGDAGPRGPTGAKGFPGPAGEPGPSGAPGAQGLDGEPGAKGAQGADGPAGATGARGRRGSEGARGQKGDTGAAGEQGDAGDKGRLGPKGFKGEMGMEGESGSPGARGSPGPRGPTGPIGHPGVDGEKGPAGDPGPYGKPGEAGDAGPRGPAGPPGPPGPPGEEIIEVHSNTFFSSERSDDEIDDTLEMTKLKELAQLRRQVRRLTKPSGTKKAPARSCLDLQLNKPHVADGYYWIDPNGGCPDDAIKVFCNFSSSTVQTCVLPSTDEVNTRYWHKTSADNWFSNLDGGFQLKYTTTEDQLNFIRTGAQTAHQTFTYTCRNSQAPQSFQTSDNRELTSNSDSVTMLHDGCKHKSVYTDHSVVAIVTRSTGQLPLKDFAPSDFGANSQEFGFQVGPACFS